MLSLWQMGLSASAVILLTAVLRWVAGNRLPRRMYVALWDVALLAGLIPFRVPWEALSRHAQQIKAAVATVDDAVFSIPSQMPDPIPILSMPVTQGTAAVLPAAVSPVPGRGLRDSLMHAVQPLRDTVQAAPDWLWQTLGIIWAVGAAVLAVAFLCRLAACLRGFSEALPCEDQRAEAFMREHRLLRRVRVRVSGRIISPLSYGLLRPIILLPASLASADDQRIGHVLAHEYLHIRAWDILRKWALLLTLCLYWPNPLAWLMVRLCNRDMELMCDERVLRLLGGRKAYCLTLLDMEARRSSLTIGTCFSVTGIEERMKVMKNRKPQGIFSIALAIVIFLSTTAGAMTVTPPAVAENASPRIFVSRDTWETSYAQYEVYGLGYDAKNGTITYNGQTVRYFEDMWPIDEQGKAGTCFMYAGGKVDVYGVREFPEYIQRNPDGSFDPSGTLIGLREATPEEYDEFTARQEASSLSPGVTTQYSIVDGYQLADAIVLNTADTALTFSVVEDETGIAISQKPSALVDQLDVEWWTAEEYRAWLEEERVALQELVQEQARAWTPSTGWFTWTQEKVDEAIARYESLLRDIEQGALVSKAINGKEANMVLVQGSGDNMGKTFSTAVSIGVDVPPVQNTLTPRFAQPTPMPVQDATLTPRLAQPTPMPVQDSTLTPVPAQPTPMPVDASSVKAPVAFATAMPARQFTSSISVDVPPSDDVSAAVSVESVPEEEAVEGTPIYGILTYHTSAAPLVSVETDNGSDGEQSTFLIGVSPDDEWRFTPQDWAKIQELAALDIIHWQEPVTAQQSQEIVLEAYQLERMESWRETIAPYAPLGLSYVLDTVADQVRLYWRGREVRGIFDPHRGTWITEHAGNGSFTDGAKELIAVYDNGVLTGLREANEEESAFWDKTREDNSRQAPGSETNP